MRQRKSGRKLLVGLGLVFSLSLALSGCRKDPPPLIDVCIADGIGGARCALKPTSVLIEKCVQEPNGYYCPPSVLENMWMTTEVDEAAFASWCYGAPVAKVAPVLEQVRMQIQKLSAPGPISGVLFLRRPYK